METVTEIQHEIDELTKRRHDLQREHDALIAEMARAGEIDADKAQRATEITTLLAVFGKRLGFLAEDKDAVHRDNLLAQYRERSLRIASHQRWESAVKDELAALDAKRAALLDELAEREPVARTDKGTRLNLRRELQRAGVKPGELDAIDNECKAEVQG